MEVVFCCSRFVGGLTPNEWSVKGPLRGVKHTNNLCRKESLEKKLWFHCNKTKLLSTFQSLHLENLQ